MRIIAGQFRHRALEAPKGPATRPTSGIVREAVFNICQGSVEGVDVLDLYAGSGAMGLEALSRGARSVTMVENDAHALRAIKKNIEALGVQQQAMVLSGDVFKSLSRIGKRFGMIYADAPYDAIQGRDKLILEIDKGLLLLPGGDFFLEEATKAKEPEVVLERLQLKSCRNYGRSQLRHYVYEVSS